VVTRGAGVALLALGLAAPARAVDRDATPVAEAAPPAEDARDRVRWRSFELRGRVLARGFRDDEDGASANDTELENARLELRFRPSRALRAVVEWDHAEGRHRKDAYVAYRRDRIEIQAGQFKPPIAPLEQESRWDLPSADRGLLSEILVDAFGVAGRRPGFAVEWNQKGDGLVGRVGVFLASSLRGDRIGDEAFDNLSKDWAALKTMARMEWRGKRVRAGVSFDRRPAEPLPGERYEYLWTGGADLEWRARGRRGPRVWLEAYTGSSWQDARPFDGQHATFAAGRALVGLRLLASKKNDVVFEPYGGGAVFDPDTRVGNDLLWEATAGLHVAALRHLRLGVEAQRRDVSPDAPLALGIYRFGSHPPQARTRLSAQLGLAF
jgi:hypothetical protein